MKNEMEENKPKFSPRPWQRKGRVICPKIQEDKDNMEIVCRIHENRFASREDANGRLIEKAPEMYQNMIDNLTTIDLATSTASTICANSCCWGRNCSSCPVSEIIRLLGVMKERTEKLKKEVDGEA